AGAPRGRARGAPRAGRAGRYIIHRLHAGMGLISWPMPCAVVILLLPPSGAPVPDMQDLVMSNEQEHNEEHASPIKSPKQLIVTVVLAFLIPIVIILLLVSMVASGTKTGAGSDSLTEEAVARRIAPVAGFELVDANAPKVFKTGEQVFQAVCTACHTAGVAGAPKLGDKAAWAPFIKSGFESMLDVALHGKGAMPAKGGNPALSDYEVARAVVYMANESGGSFEEPAAPAQEGAKPEEAKQAAAPAATPAPAAAAPAAAAAPK